MKTIHPPHGVPARFLILLLVILACGMEPQAVFAEPTLSREQTETLIKDMLKTWESGDAEKFAAAFGDKTLFAYPGDRFDKPQLVEMFKDYHREKSDIKIYFGQFLVSGDRFALTYQFAATDRQSGARQAVGSAATGRIEDGKIVLYQEYYDEHVAKRQAAKEIPLDEGYVTPYPHSLMLDPKLIN